MKGDIRADKIFRVQGADMDFDSEYDAAVASILVILGVYDEDICDAVRINLENGTEAIQKRLQTMMEPRNQQRS